MKPIGYGMKPITDQPGLYILQDTGQILNLNDFVPFETADRFEGVRWSLPSRAGLFYILQGWRFTCAKWPANPVDVQQQVTLKSDFRDMLASSSLSSILTCAQYPDMKRDYDREELGCIPSGQSDRFSVTLAEQPVEGAGLRVHIRGLLKNAIRSY